MLHAIYYMLHSKIKPFSTCHGIEPACIGTFSNQQLKKAFRFSMICLSEVS